MKLKFVFFAFSIFVIKLLSSCYSPAKLIGTNEPIRGKDVAQKITPPDGKALIYIVRRPAYFASLAEFAVSMDRQMIGHTQAQRFLYTFSEPGTRTFIGHAENKSSLSLEVEAGKTYYIEQKIRPGIVYPRNKLKVLDEKKGIKKLNQCKLARDNITLEGI